MEGTQGWERTELHVFVKVLPNYHPKHYFTQVSSASFEWHKTDFRIHLYAEWFTCIVHHSIVNVFTSDKSEMQASNMAEGGNDMDEGAYFSNLLDQIDDKQLHKDE